MKNVASYFLFNFFYFAIIVCVFFVSGITLSGLHSATIGIGILFGITFIVAVFCYMKAMETGPFSFSVLFNSSGILIPVIIGFLFWNEPVKMLQIAGLCLLLVTFYLGSASSSGEQKSVGMRWILFCLASFVGNGMIMTYMKWHQMIIPGQEMKELLTISFGTAAILSFILFVISSLSRKQEVFKLNKLHLLILILLTGIVTAYGNQLIVYLASRIPSVIQFPAINGGVVIISTLASVVLFKDKLTRNGIAGIGLGIVALVLLSI